MRTCAAALLLLCGLGSVFAKEAPAQAEVWTGWVSWVMDGDTVLVVRPGQKEPVKLRLEALDAPETCQPGGPAAPGQAHGPAASADGAALR